MLYVADTSIFNQEQYMKVNMSHAHPNDTGRMASPWLNPKPGSRCELTFQYYMYDDSYCQLSVIQETETTQAETTVWETRNKSGANFSDPQTVNVTCEQDTYRVRCHCFFVFCFLFLVAFQEKNIAWK